MRTPHIIEKGKRLASEGRVERDEHAAVYRVHTDDAIHTVVVYGSGHVICDCGEGGYCEHLEGVVQSRPLERAVGR